MLLEKISFQWPFENMGLEDAEAFCHDCKDLLITWLSLDVMADFISDYEEEFRAFMRARAEQDVEVDASWLED